MATVTSNVPITKVRDIEVNTQYLQTKNCTVRPSRNVSYIVMHYTGNTKDCAVNNAKYYYNTKLQASAHYFVDNTSIYQSVAAKNRAWHCGTNGKYYHTCRNETSIGIEMCCTAGNYRISDTTIENSAYLCAALCEMLNIKDVDTYVIRHYDVTHKKCPAQMVNNANEWTAFKAKVKSILNGDKVETKPVNNNTTTLKAEPAKSFSKSYAKTYKVTANSGLNMRCGAGTNKAKITTLKKGASFRCYGYYTKQSDGTVWLYGVSEGHTGYCSKAYLS